MNDMEGYRLLEKGEIIEAGDEWWGHDRWASAGGTCTKVNLGKYRRPIKQEWRMLEVGERIQEGDEVFVNDDWAIACDRRKVLNGDLRYRTRRPKMAEKKLVCACDNCFCSKCDPHKTRPMSDSEIFQKGDFYSRNGEYFGAVEEKFIGFSVAECRAKSFFAPSTPADWKVHGRTSRPAKDFSIGSAEEEADLMAAVKEADIVGVSYLHVDRLGHVKPLKLNESRNAFSDNSHCSPAELHATRDRAADWKVVNHKSRAERDAEVVAKQISPYKGGPRRVSEAVQHGSQTSAPGNGSKLKVDTLTIYAPDFSEEP